MPTNIRRKTQPEWTIPSVESKNNVMENRTADIKANRSETSLSSGHLYGFMIMFYDAKSGEILSDVDARSINGETTVFGGRISSALLTSSEYFFTVPPRSIALSEPSTMEITPMLDRSFIIEHQGSLLKNLSVSGTTGFRPATVETRKDASTANALFGSTLGAVNKTIDSFNRVGSIFGTDTKGRRGIDKSERTGYFNFMQLRNLFRLYKFLKSESKYRKDEGFGNKVPILVWCNLHEFEFWVCEVTNFATRRDASSPLTFSYDIQCVLLGKLENLFEQNYDYYHRLVDGTSTWGDILDGIGAINDAVNSMISIGQGVVGDINGIINDVKGMVDAISNILQIPGDLIGLGADLVGSASNAVDLGRTMANLPGDLMRSVDDNLVEWIEERRDLLANADVGFSKEELYLQRTVRKMDQILNKVRARKADAETFGHTTRGASPTSSSRRVTDEIASTNYGDRLDLRNYRESKSGVRSTVMKHETIRTIAKRLLNDESRWKEIVLQNNLKPPYIGPIRTEGVLQPGDELIVPSDTNTSKAISGNLVLPTNENLFSGTIGDIDIDAIAYGTDVQLQFTGNADQGTVVSDFEVSPRGDISTITGRNNFKQALHILVNTEKGRLKIHPNYGIPRMIGETSAHGAGTLWATSMRQTLNGEPRISSVDTVAVAVTGDVLVGRVEVTGINSLDSVPITVLGGR